MSFKAKTVLNNDIRVFKQDIDTMEDGLEAIKKFIKEKYGIEGAFSIQYEDEEKDIITVASSEDLEEAYSQADSNGTVLKLLVVPENSNAPVYEFTSELDKSALNEQDKQQQQQQGNNSDSSSDEEEEKENDKKQEVCFGKKLLQDLIENEEFRKEFINFIVSFIKIIQQDIEKFSNEALIQALSKHENISQHPSMKKLLDIFPLLFQHFEPVLFFVNTINADNIGVWINNIINLLSNVDFNQFQSIPMMLMSWFGLPFGHGPHGGHHMPPPPPPPFWFSNPYHGHNNNFNPFNTFGSFMPPPPTPPPSACPFSGFNGGPFSHHGHGHGPFHHGRRHRHGHHGYHGHGPYGNSHFGHGPHIPHGNTQGENGFGCPMFNGPMFGGNRCHGKRMWCGKNKNNENKEHKETSNQNKCAWKKNQRCHGKWNKFNENKDYNVEIINDEVTLMDKAYVLPGQTIIKTWHIKNNGNKDWPQDIKLKYCGKPFNPIINGVEFNVPNLKTNEEGDISVIIETPKDFIGKQKANFRLFLNSNEIIGPMFRVRVLVVNNYENDSLQQQQSQEEEKKDNNNENSDVIEKLKELKEQQQSVSNVSLKEKEKEEIKIPNKIESSPSSFADVNVPKIEDINFDQEEEEDDAMIIEEPEQEQQPIMESNINNNYNNNINIEEYDFDYVYQDQLNTILAMGFDGVDKIRNLLNANKGDLNVVINQLFQ